MLSESFMLLNFGHGAVVYCYAYSEHYLARRFFDSYLLIKLAENEACHNLCEALYCEVVNIA